MQQGIDREMVFEIKHMGSDQGWPVEHARGILSPSGPTQKPATTSVPDCSRLASQREPAEKDRTKAGLVLEEYTVHLPKYGGPAPQASAPLNPQKVSVRIPTWAPISV